MASLLDRFRHPRSEEPAAGAEGTPPAPRRRPLPSPGQLRRERRNLLRVREQRIRDIGGLVLEMYRQDRFRQDLDLRAGGGDRRARGASPRDRRAPVRREQPAGRRRAALRAVRDAALLRRAVLPELRPPGDRGADVTQPPAGACPRCGTAYTPGQEYCLECGLRLPTRNGIFSGIAASWAEQGWYPGDWVWPVLVFLVLAGIGALAAILSHRRRQRRARSSPYLRPARAEQVTVPHAVADRADRHAASSAADDDAAAAEDHPGPDHSLTVWPAPTATPSFSSRSRRARARRTRCGRRSRRWPPGLPQVGVLDSARYSSLHRATSSSSAACTRRTRPRPPTSPRPSRRGSGPPTSGRLRTEIKSIARRKQV